MVDIENHKKRSEAEVRQKMVEHRQFLIKEFENSLIQMENRLMEQIVTVDEEFIQSIGSADQQLTRVKQNLSKGLNSL